MPRFWRYTFFAVEGLLFGWMTAALFVWLALGVRACLWAFLGSLFGFILAGNQLAILAGKESRSERWREELTKEEVLDYEFEEE